MAKQVPALPLLVVLLILCVTGCKADCPSLGDLSNGQISYSTTLQTSGYPFLTIGTHTCNNGFVLTGGDALRVCVSDGSWSGSGPSCLPASSTCSPLDNPANGLITYATDMDPEFEGDTTATYSCMEGFALSGGDTVRICEGSPVGSWNGNAPTCEAIMCLDTPDPENGQIVFDPDTHSPFMYGTVASYSCFIDGERRIGYGLTDGNYTRTCGSNGSDVIGAWSGTAPRCELIICPELEAPDNGTITSIDRNFRRYVYYGCNTGFGFSAGNWIRVCLGSDRSPLGYWSNSAAVCTAIVCSSLGDFANGIITYENDTIPDHDFGTTATYTCNDGYRLIVNYYYSVYTSYVRSCVQYYTTSTGFWNPRQESYNNILYCEYTRCSSLGVPSNGRPIEYSRNVSADGNYDTSTTATYNCLEGFALSGGSGTRTCNIRYWYGGTTFCQAIMCLDLPNPVNGRIDFTPDNTALFEYNTTATYVCEIGFGLTDDAVRTCGGDQTSTTGVWSGQSPSCQAIMCAELAGPDNGQIVYTTDTTPDFEFGTTATYVCDPEYGLHVGDGIRMCGGDGSTYIGTWDGDVPICEPITCMALSSPANGQVTYSTGQTADFNYGTVATFSCDRGYGISVGDNIRICGGDSSTSKGEWSGIQPLCEPVVCPSLSDPMNGDISYSVLLDANGNFPFEATATYSCDEGFGQRNGIVVRTCDKDDVSNIGSFNGDPGICEDITCTAIPVPDSSTTMYSVAANADGNYPYGTTVTFVCSSGYGLVPGSIVRTCGGDGRSVVGGFDENSPTCETIMCSLSDPPNGFITFSGGTLANGVYPFGTTAAYDCNPGYSLVPLGTVRTCTGDGSSSVGLFNGNEPDCEGIICPRLTDDPTNGLISYSNEPDKNSYYPYGTSADYICNEGYGLVLGVSTRTCTGDGSSTTGSFAGQSSTCGEITCPGVPDIDNGERIYDGTPLASGNFAFGVEARYRCDNDYTLEGVTTRHCDGNGTSVIGAFDDIEPICDLIVTCAELSAPINGNVTYNLPRLEIEERLDYDEGAVATFTCDVGFFLNGTTERICTSVGVVVGIWNEASPFCQGITCPALTEVTNGLIDFTPDMEFDHDFGTMANFTCNPGFGLVGGDDVRVCTGDGTSPVGTWTGTQGTCELMCPPLSAITNGVITYGIDTTPDFDVGTQATHTCDLGYGLTEDAVRTCTANADNSMATWSGNVPTCETIICDELTFPENGVIAYTSGTSNQLVFGTLAVYTCSNTFGIHGGDAIRTCGGNGSTNIGTFDGSGPTCEPIMCSILEPPQNGQVVFSTPLATAGYELDTTATYSCDDGYSLVGGGALRTCGGASSSSVGVWSGNEPSCLMIMCPDLIDPDHGRITYSPDVLALFDFGTVATYECDSGYAVSGNDERSCEGNGISTMGTWSGDPPTCNVIQCSELMPPDNGAVSYSTSASPTSSYDFGTIATFSCNSGFAVSGNIMRTCGGDSSNLNGVWSGNDITCVAIQCPALTVPENGEIVYMSDMSPNHDHGTTATYSCQEGYGLSGGNVVRTCGGDGSLVTGEWSGSLPSCEPIQCLALETPDNGRITYATDKTPNFDYGTTATYSCDLGYGLNSGATVRVCGGNGESPNGQWSGNAPTCENNVMCLSLPNPMNGEVVYSSDTTGDQEFGATATYVCDSGFGLSGGERVRTCSSDGTSTTGFWTGSQPSCLDEITCQLVSEPENGMIAYSVIASEVPYNTTATYSCDVGFGLSGGEEVRMCEGDGNSLDGMWTGDPPTCEVITCDDLPDPPNGEIIFTPDNTAPFRFGTNASYSCDLGFGLSGGVAVRTCEGDGSSPNGEWEGNAPTCEGGIMCPSLPDPMNGEVVYSSDTTGDQEFGATATYVCDSGFGLSGGERVRTCSSDGTSTTGFWTGSQPSCLAGITCQALAEPVNGLVVYSTITISAEIPYNTTATYSCDVGFGLSGGEEVRTCEGDGNSLDGMWTGDPPTCEAITCEDLLNPPNGEIIFTPDNTAPFSFGTNATYSCDSGFGLSEGVAVRTCEGDGSSPNGEWEGNAPTCEGGIMCPSLPDPMNGEVVYSSDTTGDQEFGATATYVCDSGFGLSGGERVRTCSSDGTSTTGFWTGSQPSCFAGITCQVLAEPMNGQVVYSTLTKSAEIPYNTTATYSCDVGFGLSGGEEVRMCEGDGNSLDGMWTGDPPTCEAITCEDLLNPPNGEIIFTPDNTAPFIFRTDATYSCDSGFGLSGGVAVRTCEGDGSSPNGEWEGNAPTCEVIQCSELMPPDNGAVSYSTSASPTSSYDFGTRATFSCNSGFAVSGNVMRTCGGDSSTVTGVWNGINPTCIAIECPALTVPENGEIVYMSDMSPNHDHGTTATYSCQEGYGLSGGNVVRTCGGDGSLVTGEWSGSPPSCEPIQCLALETPDYGRITYTTDKTPNFDYGTTATYSCDLGYGLNSGATVRVCGGNGESPNGQWSGDAPTCENNVMCPSLPDPMNGEVVYSSDTTGDQEFGATATYVCDSGFGLSRGERVRTCSSDGTSTTGFWTGSQPSCLAEITCSLLTSPNNGQIYYSSPLELEIPYNTTATYSCDVGFGLSGGEEVRMCEGDGNSLDGTWTGDPPTCEAIMCDHLPDPSNGDISFYSDNIAPFDFETNASYSCDPGYGLSGGDTVRICDGDGSSPNGEWSGDAPICALITCSSVTAPMNGDIQYLDDSIIISGRFLVGTMVQYSCLSGYGLTGGSVIRTCSGDGSSYIGTWSGLAPVCEVIVCPSVLPPLNGQVMFTSNDFGSAANYTCNVGFGITGGDVQRVCYGTSDSPVGSWTGTAPSCERIMCALLPDPMDGQVSYSRHSTSVFQFGDIATYTCSTGRGLNGGNETRLCVGGSSSPNGYWTGNMPSCEPIRCPPLLSILNGVIEYSEDSTTDFSFEVVARYDCTSGFAFSEGDSVRQCTGDGRQVVGYWSGTAPVCSAIVCRSLEEPVNGQIVYSTNSTASMYNYGTTATYICGSSYILSSSFTESRVCEGVSVQGFWSGYAPTCKFTPLREGVDYLPFIDVFKNDGVILYELVNRLGCSEQIYMNTGFPLGSKTETRLRVCSNGVISFGSGHFYFSYPERFPSEHPSIRATNVVAPFWNAHDALLQGDIVYKVYTQSSGVEAHEYIDLVSEYISRQRGTNFTGSWMLVAYWVEVPPYGYSALFGSGRVVHTGLVENQVPKNSYQAIVITDGIQTYAVFSYNCEKLQWTAPVFSDRHSVIGYNLNTDFSRSTSIPAFQNHQLSTDPGIRSVACINTADNVDWSNIIYKIGETNNRLQLARAECVRLRDLDIKRFGAFFYYPYSSPCPCSVFQALRDSRYSEASYINKYTPAVQISEFCFTQNFPPLSYGTHLCCYGRSSNNFGALLDSSYGADGSSLLRYHPVWHFSNYVEYDYKFQHVCCKEADLCVEYTRLRPSDSCRSYKPLVYSWSKGDPHITTLDGRVYTFNGWGEYTLLNIDTENTSFVLQGRTQPVVNSSATQFTAFAFGVPRNSVIEVQLDGSTKEMSVSHNSMDVTQNISVVNETYTTMEVIVQRASETSFTMSFASGIGVTITESSDILSIILTVPPNLNGTISGLLGNFNGNISDEFVYPNGSLITDKASDREIHDFGQSWEILPEDSLFTYPGDLGPGNFSHPDHIPAFLDEVVANASPEVLAACGNNTECIFDASETGDINIGLETVEIDDINRNDQAIASNNPPRISGPSTLFIKLGEKTELSFTVTDDNNNYNVFVIGGLPDNSTLTTTSNYTDGLSEYVFTWYLHEVVNFSLVFEARDNFEAVSVLNVQVQICACENDGNCTMDGLLSISGSSIVLNCQCPEAWEGDICTEDVDGCKEMLCFEGVECIDVPAPGVGAVCGPCPDGFTKDRERCQDIDECLNGTDTCQHICVNTEGSFECDCQSGYRLVNATQCKDIDECSVLNGNCHQTCTNEEGYYFCSCQTGFELLHNNKTCQALAEYSCSNDTNCTQNCIRLFGEDQCSCYLGYELDDDNVTCTNINECLQQPCDQVCNDTDGGFECSCNDGYELAEDGTVCNDISECVLAALSGIEICTPPLFCINLPGSYKCDCPGGTILTNGTCHEIEPPPTTPPSPTTLAITLSPEIEVNAVKITLSGFTADSFDTERQQVFIETTAVAINTYCEETFDKCLVAFIRSSKFVSMECPEKCLKRQIDTVTPDDIVLTDITDNEHGQLTFNMHVLVSGIAFLTATTLKESIEGSIGEYNAAGFSDLSVELLIPPTTEAPSVVAVPSLSAGQLAGSIVAAVAAAVIILLVVIVLLCYVKYKSGHTKSVNLQSHSLEYTNPVAEEMKDNEDKATFADKEKEVELAAAPNIYVNPQDVENDSSLPKEEVAVTMNDGPSNDSPVYLEESGKILI